MFKKYTDAVRAGINVTCLTLIWCKIIIILYNCIWIFISFFINLIIYMYGIEDGKGKTLFF